MAESYLLEMRDLENKFPGVKALNKANLLLKKGSVHALIGRKTEPEKVL